VSFSASSGVGLFGSYWSPVLPCYNAAGTLWCGRDTRCQRCLLKNLGLLIGSYRDGGPTIFAQVKHGLNVEHIVQLILSAWKASGAAKVSMKTNGSHTST